jgi:hypothetical protein
VPPPQYAVLVRLFATLGERKELTGNLGMDRHAMQLTSYWLLLPGGFMALMGLGPVRLAQYDLVTLSISSVILAMLLVMEAANSFFNPAEVAVLAHRPIAGRTYFAAKLTYLLQVVFWAELALNGPAALVGTFKPDARWFYPLTHLAAAWAAGTWLALSACAVFGVMFRVLPPSRLRSAALWMQLLVALLPFAGNVGVRQLRRVLASFGPGAHEIDWSFVPLVWFNALGTLGQGGGVVPLGGWALAGMAVALAFVAFGVRSLSASYMTRIVGVMRASRMTERRQKGPSTLSRIVRRLSGRPSGQAAYEFVTRMMRRDWQFRRAAMHLLLPVVVFGPALVVSSRAASPLGAATPQVIGLLPELLPFGALSVCMVIAFSDHFRGAWIFGAALGRHLDGYLRGLYWTIWIVFLALPLALAAFWFTWFWGIADAALFTAYALAVTSCLLSFQLLIVDALPFTRAPKAERPVMSIGILIIGGLVVGVAWVTQAYFLFRSHALTAAAAVAFAWLAWAAARYSLRELHRTATAQLAQQGGGPVGMFEAPDRL